MKKLLILLMSFWLIGLVHAQELNQMAIRGQVIDQDSRLPLPGVNVLIKGTIKGTITDEKGEFILPATSGKYLLVLSFIGYLKQEFEVDIPQLSHVKVLLSVDEISLASVEVLSTGIQEISAERATGSFSHLNNELISRRVSTNLLDRMEDLTPGLVFNRDRADLAKGESISIRGQSSLFSDTQPLIILDNLAYDGAIENINPNDVESITVLKDAAAASIWGAKAGNGVIVITTKKGKLGSPLKVNLTSNSTLGQSFNPFYAPQMSVADFVEVEQRLFQQGVYDGDYNAYDQKKLSPVVESLFQQINGEITDSDLQNRLSGYKTTDLRSYLAEDFYSNSFSQQIALNLSGGSETYGYFVGLGYDRIRESTVSDLSQRITLNLRQNWKSVNSKLNMGLQTYLVSAGNSSGFPVLEGLSPYDKLKDEAGYPLSVMKNYNSRFIESLRDTDLLNWDFIPLNEINASSIQNRQLEFRIAPSISYELLKGLVFRMDYQYWRSHGSRKQINSLDSYFSRNLINLYSTVSQNGSVNRVIPVGGINDLNFSEAYSHTLRSQLNYQRQWGKDQDISAILGFELKDFQRESSQDRAYGVDPITGIPQPVDYLGYYPLLNTGFPYQTPFMQNFGAWTDRFLSAYANAGYTLKNKYLLTGSLRRDASNLYGVSTNARAVPLWSAGLGWIISEESWLDKEWISYLKFKVSYGFNGNTNPSATAFTTAQYFSAATNSLVGKPWLSILNPPNPQLRWERIKIVNLGAEFELWKQRLTGSLEFYHKQGIDLFGVLPTYPSSGQSSLTKNYAATRTKGVDLAINSRVLKGGLSWNASIIYSYINERAVDYQQKPTATQAASYSSGLSGISPVPVEGYPLFSVFSFPFAGLDPITGDPLGLLEGQPSTDYTEILNRTTLEDLQFEGSSIPTHIGGLRNSVTWKGFELSSNVTFRLGYYFKKESVEYDQLNRGQITHADYAIRWRNSGDELITTVPSDPLKQDPRRATFDQISSRRVRKGDHIRWQDIKLSYSWSKSTIASLPFEQIRIYSYLDNLGILWKAAKDVKDPDFRNYQAPRTYSMGLSITF
ncbi:SusC/RagA family TonB-linked outer membrane protein [Algoriphagus aquimarinus]|uniref:SusC/RagA family TonB-linked outer membrane protein n=1 Tax=Algoriphagus aquimarinus TaxID=237018 RepID=UPI0030DA6FF8|tara:strand:+ start:12950 stop:16156 length:3207 start_codon:yes stop_codon:yes gene_type:complete